VTADRLDARAEPAVPTILSVARRAKRGRVLTIVGPDGSGKTTLGASLVNGVLADRPVLVLANRTGAARPGLLPHRAVRGPTTAPHRHPPYPSLLSLAKWLYLFADLSLGWLARVRPFVRRGGWVVVERGWWDAAVDPLRYRLRPAPRLTELLGWLFPRSDLVLVLEAEPEVIRRRKAQLSAEELDRQGQAWHRTLSRKQRRAFLDASLPASEVVRAAALEILALDPPGRFPRVHDKAGVGAQDRPGFEARWIRLLRQLSDRFPLWIAWKNADVALDGTGDVDALCPETDWNAMTDEFVSWSSREGLSPVVVCRHVPGSMLLMAADPQTGALFELDVKAWGTHRGRVIFGPHDLLPMSVLDPRGFRRLRPGAEGLLKLTVSGLRRTGALRTARLDRERVATLLTSDPDGVGQATSLLRGVRGSARRLTEHVTRGTRLSRRAGLLVELWAFGGALFHPGWLARRAAFRLAGRRVCPGLKTQLKRGALDRRGPAAWPRDVLEPHRVEVAES
jgi:thymidylate kinase